jgi:hypothetical protein
MQQNKASLNRHLGFIAILSLSLSAPVSANIGKVLMAVGDVKAKRVETVKLKRGDQLLEKDIVVTGKRGRAQLYMVDGAKIALKPSSELSLEQYQFSTGDENVIGKSDSSMTMSLIKGGFRTISGAIGEEKDKSKYQVKTPIATIGIRGTDYSAFICDETCVALDGKTKVSQGVYFGVAKGSISIQNQQGQLVIGKNQYAFVASANSSPVRITQPPKNLVSEAGSQNDEPTDDEMADTSVAGNDSEPSTDETPGAEDSAQDDDNISIKDLTGGVTPDVVVPVDGGDEDGNPIRLDDNAYDLTDTRSIAYGGVNGSNGYSVVTQTPADSLQTTEGSLNQFYALSADGQLSTEYSLNQAQAFNVGFDPASGISWGRWSNGAMQLVSDNGETQLIDLTSSSLHWALDNSASGQALPVTGSANYQLIGNTEPTDNLGQVGIVGSASLFVDFTNSQVATDVSIGIGQDVWQASGAGTIASGSHLFNGDYESVFINDSEIGVGSFAGFLSQQVDASNLPAGAALIYTLANDANSATQVVSGSLIFGTPRRP